MQVNSWHGTIVVAFFLCLVCSLIVSFTADTLKEERKANVELDVKRNLLLSAGLITGKKASPDEIEEKFKNVEIKVVDLDTGQPVPSSQLSNPSTFDARKSAITPSLSGRTASILSGVLPSMILASSPTLMGLPVF